MRFGGRLAAAIEILAEVDKHHRPAAEALKDWGVSHRFAGSGDRAAIGNLVYDALRWRLSTAWLMGEDTPRALTLGVAARDCRNDVDELVRRLGDDPHGPTVLSAQERVRLASTDLDGAPDHARADVPEWLAARFKQAFGEDWISEGAALASRPPLDMRANRLKADRSKVRKALSRHKAAETPFSPEGLRIAPTTGDRRHPNVQIEPAFQKGWFEIQDEGSQLTALLVGAKPGERVLDLCAGAGGKALALSAAMANKGQIFATDRDRARLAPAFDRLKRAATRNVQIREAGAPLDDLEGRMDAVLIDAPCSGTGVWRRRPDAKWRLSARALADRVAEQTALLAGAVRFVRPGGRLVYVTCSLLPEENGAQVDTLIEAMPEFRPIAPGAMVSAAGLPDQLTTAALQTATGMLLSPAKTGTDGFFIAALTRAE